MESPFFPPYWKQNPRYYPAVGGGVPVQRKSISSPKVVSIPVHFIESDAARVKATLKIQKVARGFLVRKNLKKMAAVKKDVEEMEKRISNKETAQVIRKEEKERLRINEMLMASLIKLDSVRGFDSGVRDLRKSIIKKAIALQERVDALVSLEDSDMDVAEAVVDEADVVEDESAASQNQTMESQDEELVDCINNEFTTDHMPVDSKNNLEEMIMDAEELGEREEEVDGGQPLTEGKDDREEIVGNNCDTVTRDLEEITGGGGVEKMMEDNKKMMSIMNQLVERNELQTKMLLSLTQRVAQLEKAFLCDKLRRNNVCHKKKKQAQKIMDLP